MNYRTGLCFKGVYPMGSTVKKWQAPEIFYYHASHQHIL